MLLSIYFRILSVYVMNIWLTLILFYIRISKNTVTTLLMTIQNYQRDALNIIYSSNIITILYMFRVSSTHLQEDIVVHKQHMVPSLSILSILLPIAAYQQELGLV